MSDLPDPPPLRQSLRARNEPPIPYTPLPEGRRSRARSQGPSHQVEATMRNAETDSSGDMVNTSVPLPIEPKAELSLDSTSTTPKFSLSRTSSFTGVYPLSTAAFDYSLSFNGSDPNFLFAPPPLPSAPGLNDVVVPVPSPSSTNCHPVGEQHFNSVENPIASSTQPPRGSLAYIRSMQASSIPAHTHAAVIYIGFPRHGIPNRRGFLLPHVPIQLRALHHILSALRNGFGVVSEVLNSVCGELAAKPFLVASSKILVEVHNEYSSASTGYQEIGALAEHLQASDVMLVPAVHTRGSQKIFEINSVDERKPLYVINIFSLEQEFPATPATVPRIQQPRTTTSRSLTPAAAESPSSANLKEIQQICGFFDANYLAEGYALSKLSDMGFATAYLQIRQSLIIEDLLNRAKSLRPRTTLAEVATWAGIKPASYSNNRTFTISARSTLQYLRTRTDIQMQSQSEDVRAAERDLLRFLQNCFKVDLLTDDWKETEELHVGVAMVKHVIGFSLYGLPFQPRQPKKNGTPESNPEQLQSDYFELGANSTKLALACLSGLLYAHEIGVTTPDVDSDPRSHPRVGPTRKRTSRKYQTMMRGYGGLNEGVIRQEINIWEV
ncbi:hypothetical protein C8J57DRAFT_1251045 [Mycena rebaudengoi]|nr:hypothetical protein C8J57DRAFT_1251045 [Mycena rebaudengoi]